MFDIQPVLKARRGLAIQIARELKITHGAVSQWRKVPADRVLVVERLTGIPRHVLRSDVFPSPDQKGAA